MVATACIAMLCAGCVEKEYSLSNIEGSENRIGDVITAPPVTARISFEGLMGGMSEIERILQENGLTLDDIGKTPVDIGNQEFAVSLPLHRPLIPEGMLDIFTTASGSGDSTDLLLSIESTLPMSVEFRLEFTDSAGSAVFAFDELFIEGSPDGERKELSRRQDISALIQRLPDIKELNITLLRPDVEKVAFLLDNYIMIETRIEKRGGIEFTF